MPWHIMEQANKLCVVKDDDGEVEGCHATRVEAERQLSALYASEADRGIKEEFMDVENGLIAKIALVIKSAFRADEPYVEEVGAPGLTLWKEADGTMRWLGVFSNNFRDDDKPAEILSAEAHRDFADAVDKGEWPSPELLFWHVPNTRYGVAESVMFDEDTGFQLAMGTIDPGMEGIAQYCQAKGFVMSHGMPPDEVQRDADDPTIIIRYRSKEVSSLPAEAAANKITSFVTDKVQGEKSMNIPDKKVQELEAAGFNVAELTEQLTAAKTRAEDEQRESKEVKDEAVVEAAGEVTEAEVVEEITEVVPEPAPGFTAEDVASAASMAINASMAPVTEALAGFAGRLDAIEGAMKQLTTKQAEVAAELELTPAASLAQMIKSSVIGNDETYIDGRTTEAKDKPKEAPSNVGATGIPFLDAMKEGKDWRTTIPGQ